MFRSLKQIVQNNFWKCSAEYQQIIPNPFLWDWFKDALRDFCDTWGICTRRAGKLYRARSRLYRSQILQVNTRWKKEPLYCPRSEGGENSDENDCNYWLRHTLESSRRDLHSALLCIILYSQCFVVKTAAIVAIITLFYQILLLSRLILPKFCLVEFCQDNHSPKFCSDVWSEKNEKENEKRLYYNGKSTEEFCRIFAGFSKLGPSEMYRVPGGYPEVTREGPRSLHFRGKRPIPRLQKS